MNIKTNSKIKIAMLVLFVSLIIPNVSFAWLGIPCLNPFSSSTQPDSFWNCTGYDTPTDTSVVSGTLQGETSNSTSNTSALTSSGKGVGSLFDLVQAFLSRALVLLISLAVVWFVWNAFRYVIAADEIDKAVAKDKMVWGIIAIFVMVSVWGLVAVLQYTFQIFPSSSGPKINSVMPTFNL